MKIKELFFKRQLLTLLLFTFIGGFTYANGYGFEDFSTPVSPFSEGTPSGSYEMFDNTLPSQSFFTGSYEDNGAGGSGIMYAGPGGDPIGGRAPIGDGVWLLLGLLILYGIIKNRHKLSIIKNKIQ